MAITFPISPTIGDIHQVGDVLYTWDGVSWDTDFNNDTESLAVRLNTAKVGITPTQAGNILTNNDKVGADAQATNQGNVFNGNEQLVKTDALGKLPALDGSALTGLGVVEPEWVYVNTHTDAAFGASVSIDNTMLGESFDWEAYSYKINITIDSDTTAEGNITLDMNSGGGTINYFNIYYLSLSKQTATASSSVAIPIGYQYADGWHGEIVFEQEPLIQVGEEPRIRAVYHTNTIGDTTVSIFDGQATFLPIAVFSSIDIGGFTGITGTRLLNIDIYKRKRYYSSVQI
jgi:hypothetical protein